MQQVIPLIQSLATDQPNDPNVLVPPSLDKDIPQDQQAFFFKAILNMIAKEYPLEKKTKTVNTARKMFIAVFIYKFLLGFDAPLLKNEVKFCQSSIYPPLSLDVVKKVNKFLRKCGVSKTDRTNVLTEFHGWKVGKGNGLVGRFLAKLSFARRNNKGWHGLKKESDSITVGGRVLKKQTAPWIGHVISLACLFPEADAFQTANPFAQHPLEQGSN